MKNPHLPPFRRTLIASLALATLPTLALAETETNNDKKNSGAQDVTELPAVHVSEQNERSLPFSQSQAEKYKLPVTTETVTTQDIEERVNITTVEDAIKYEPSLLVRKRYVGEVNAPLATRTTNVGQSARTLIYADGILLSTLLGNNNGNTGSPRWNTVAPGEIERVDMLYGPFSAAYAGNSIGGVLNMTTKMPKKFEAGADIQGSWSDFRLYNHNVATDSQNYSANIGDRVNDFAFRFDFNHLDSNSQPIAFATRTISDASVAAKSALKVTGAPVTENPYGVAINVLGATNINHTEQNNFKWKATYDITPTLRASYTLGMWQNNGTTSVQSYLNDAHGNPVYGGSLPVNINGKSFALSSAATPTNLNGSTSNVAFIPTLIEQTTWSHGMSLKSDTGGKFDWELVGSLVELGKDTSRAPTQDPTTSAASPTGGIGRTTVLTGSNWNTADAKGIWRPGDFYGKHEVSFGFHNDFYQLVNPVYNNFNWQSGGNVSLFSDSEGKTMTQGYWLQDAWDFERDWNLTVGGRLENWDAYDGLNSTRVNIGTTNNPNFALKTINQTDKNSVNFSPKGKLTWNPTDTLRFGAAIGQAYRYPTASELFQTSTSGTTVLNGNPNLKPERALSSEISAEYFLPKGKLRLSFFQEKVNNAIYTANTLLSNGFVSSVPTNVDQTDTYGLEFAGEVKDVFFESLNIYGSGTWADSRITENAAVDAASLKNGNSAANPHAINPSTGMMQPRIPTYRATFSVSYSPIDHLTTSISGRYGSATYGQLNNSDIVQNTYTGGGTAYFVVDTKVNYQIDKQWSINAGIDNINNENYWIFHPFPQRTYMAQLKFKY